MRRCEFCEGAGETKRGKGWEKCEACDGSGQAPVLQSIAKGEEMIVTSGKQLWQVVVQDERVLLSLLTVDEANALAAAARAEREAQA